MASYYVTEEQDNSTTQLPDDPKKQNICIPQNLVDKKNRTKNRKRININLRSIKP